MLVSKNSCLSRLRHESSSAELCDYIAIAFGRWLSSRECPNTQPSPLWDGSFSKASEHTATALELLSSASGACSAESTFGEALPQGFFKRQRDYTKEIILAQWRTRAVIRFPTQCQSNTLHPIRHCDANSFEIESRSLLCRRKNTDAHPMVTHHLFRNGIGHINFR